MASDSSENSSLMRIRSSNFTFQFEINYSKSKNLPNGKYISSPVFTAGGYEWSLLCYPQGSDPANKGSYVSLYLRLQSEVDEEVSVEYSFGLLNNIGKFFAISVDTKTIFTSYNNNSWGYEKVIEKERIENFYCKNDMIIVSCNIKVLTVPKVIENPGDLCNHIEKFWEKGERFDVTFEVEGEKISAHRFMLAARSPVFETELYGPMAEAKMDHILINEMKPEVFKSMLHFIYTDQLPKDGCDTLSVELFQGLLTAADRYLLDKLTILCEKQLEKNLSVDTVITTLFVADRHSRVRLKQKCLEFASSPENFSQVALTEGYLSVMLAAPSLLAELRKKVNCSSHCAKK